MSEWIPVSERLPAVALSVNGNYSTSQQLLVFAWKCEVALYEIVHTDATKTGWYTPVSGHKVCDVTHWMPLPEPPKG